MCASMKVGKRGGIIYFLSRQNKGRSEEHDPMAGFEPRTFSIIKEKKKTA